MRFRPKHLLVPTLLGALLGAGCGYQTTGSFNPDANRGYEWKSLYREDVQTVAVPIFASRSFQRGAENDLTKAVITQLELRSPYKVVPRNQAQTILEGEIEDIEVNRISQDGQTLLPNEQQLTMTVNFTWKDIRTGRIIVERRSFRQSAIYYSQFGEGRTQGTLSATEKLAVAIVQQLEADW